MAPRLPRRSSASCKVFSSYTKVQGEASRPLLEGFDRTGWDWLSADSSLSQGAMRAGLIIGWGVFDRFYPFF